MLRSLYWINALVFAAFLMSIGCNPSSNDKTIGDTNTATSAAPESALAVAGAPIVPVYTGDLAVMAEQGVIRFILPTSDGEPGLARNGLAAAEFERLAESFAQSQGLTAQWIYKDYFDQLIPSLKQGAGDVVITNLTVTDKRRALVDFTLPIETVDERLIIQKPLKAETLQALGPVTVTVPAGTSYLESMEELLPQYSQLKLDVIDSDLSDFAMIEAVARGDMQATVVDSNIAKEFFAGIGDPAGFNAVIGPVVKSKRQIAWAVRKDSSQLLTALNHFLISERILASSIKYEKRDWPQIQAHKTLRLITTNNPASYFIWRGELMGFDYDLVRKFADLNHLRLQVIVRDSFESMWQALQKGEGDVIAAAMTATEPRRERGMLFSRPYLQVSEQLIGRSDEIDIADIAELKSRTIAVNPEKSYKFTLDGLKKRLLDQKRGPLKLQQAPTTQQTFTLVEVPGATTEELIEAVASGEYDFTVADSHLAEIESTYRDNIKVMLELNKDQPIAFALRQDQSALKSQLDGFVKKQYRGLFYNVTYNKYFKNKKNIVKNRKHRIEPDKPISPFDAIVQQRANEFGYDWRLLTAQMYQESRFDPNAESYAGAQGLMQVLPRTAQQFGYENLYDPMVGIEAGVVYFDWLRDRFPDELPLEEQMYFMLAAYNAGHGHVRDARRLAVQLGKDPNQWFGNVEEAMLLLSKPKYYKSARFGYVRGIEPVNYVKNIRQRYLSYLSTHRTQVETSAASAVQ